MPAGAPVIAKAGEPPEQVATPFQEKLAFKGSGRAETSDRNGRGDGKGNKAHEHFLTHGMRAECDARRDI